MKKYTFTLIILLSFLIAGCTKIGSAIIKYRTTIEELEIQDYKQLHEILSTYQLQNKNVINIIKKSGSTDHEFFHKNEVAIFFRYVDERKAKVFTELKIYNGQQERQATPQDEMEFTSDNSDFKSYIGIAFTAKSYPTQPKIEIYRAIADDFDQFIKTDK